jgi:hypothetical protein
MKEKCIKRDFIYESGQAIVLVLLSLSVVLTIVLFVMSRSITDISTSTNQADSVRAFSAAEAGVENALVAGSNVASGVDGDKASYNAIVIDIASGSKFFDYPIPLISGDTMTIWFVNHDSATGSFICNVGSPCFTGNAFRVCWGNPGTPSDQDQTPAVEVSVYYETTPGDISTVQIARITFDPNDIRQSSNSFDAEGTGSCQNYAFTKTINFATNFTPAINVYSSDYGLIFAKVRMFYNTEISHNIGVRVDVGDNSSRLPSQGKVISSTGKAGQSNRKVNVFQGWPEFPFSGMAIFSLPGITK